MYKETFLPTGVDIVTLQRELWEDQIRIDAIFVHKLRSRIKQMQSVMSGQLLFFSCFMACGLDLRVFPAEIRLTVYCWLLILQSSIFIRQMKLGSWDYVHCVLHTLSCIQTCPDSEIWTFRGSCFIYLHKYIYRVIYMYTWIYVYVCEYNECLYEETICMYI